MKRRSKKKIKIHNHPLMEQSSGLDSDHVIVDRELYEEIRNQCGDWLEKDPPYIRGKNLIIDVGEYGTTFTINVNNK